MKILYFGTVCDLLEYEKKSNDDIIDPMEIERYCQAFYQQGLKAEEVLKK